MSNKKCKNLSLPDTKLGEGKNHEKKCGSYTLRKKWSVFVGCLKVKEIEIEREREMKGGRELIVPDHVKLLLRSL